MDELARHIVGLTGLIAPACGHETQQAGTHFSDGFAFDGDRRRADPLNDGFHLDLVLVGEATRVDRLAVGPHQDQLAHPHTGMDPKGPARDVAHLEHLSVSHPRLHECGGNVHHQAETGEAAAALQEATHVGGQGHPLSRDPVNRDAGIEYEALGQGRDGGVFAKVGLVLDLDGTVARLDEANLVAQGEIDGRSADRIELEGLDANASRLDLAENHVTGQDGHGGPHVIVSPMPHPYFEVAGPMILGHRGAAGCAPENTLLSFARCLEQGAHSIESDVQITADGVPVLMHDPDVGRITNGKGSVQELTLAELETLDAGHRFTIEERGTAEPDDEAAFRGQGLQVPSVREAFATLPRARFNLEIKTAANEAVAKVVDLVAELGRADRTLLTAGDDGIMKSLRETLARRGVDAATSASVADVVAAVRAAVDGGEPPAEVQALQIPTRFGDRELVTDVLLSYAHQHGIQVHVWTVNEVAEMERLLDLGVDGLVTDFPGRMARLLGAG